MLYNSPCALSAANVERYRSGHNGADSKSCYLCPKLNIFTMKTYRSGRNELDSKSAMYSDGVSVENPVVMRVFRLWKFHNHLVSALNVRPSSKRHSVRIIMERYRRGHNGADSKSVEPRGSVGSNPTRSARKASKHAGLLAFFFFKTSSTLYCPCDFKADVISIQPHSNH